MKRNHLKNITVVLLLKIMKILIVVAYKAAINSVKTKLKTIHYRGYLKLIQLKARKIFPKAKLAFLE